MKTIQLKISNKVYDQFLLLLSKFNTDEIEIINETALFVSEPDLQYTSNTIKISKTKKDWFSLMTEEEQKEIKTGLEQADKGEFVANEKVMQRFNKWH